MNRYDLANIMFPNVTKTISDYEKMYPKRNIDENAIVTRFAPSPTGFVHMGSLLTAFIASKVTIDTNGVFYIRIEDTDAKREVDNGIDGIIKDLSDFNIKIDEGVISKDEQIGNYGPYIQTQRKEIYDCFAKYMIENDLAVGFMFKNLAEKNPLVATVPLDPPIHVDVSVIRKKDVYVSEGVKKIERYLKEHICF